MTPAYCSTEQAEKRALSCKTDIGSWAVTFLEMLVGEVCWASGTAAPEVLERLPELRSDALAGAETFSSVNALSRECLRPGDKRPKHFAEVVESLRSTYQQLASKS